MIKGIDISEYQPNIDLNQLRSQIDFIIIRSSYGNGYIDKSFATHRDQIRNAGIACGFYHYAYPQYNSGRDEAAWFLQTVQPQSGEILCLDFEENWSGDAVAWCKEFLDYVSLKLNGYKPLLYINLSTSRSKNWSSVINSGYGLWLADWDNNLNNPGQSNPWQRISIRQYTDQANIPGIPGNVDADVFYGDLNSFKASGFQTNRQQQPQPVQQFTSKPILQIQPLSQRDTRWASQRLGTVNGVTIGSDGCVITDMAMLSTYYGHPITPNALDDILTNQNLYYDGDLFVNGSITKIFPDIKFDKVVFCESTPAPISEIKQYLDAGKPSVVALINQGVRHYILVTGYDGDRIYCNDPWMGDQVAINERWGDPTLKILQVNYFSGQPVIPQIPVTPQMPPIIFTTPVSNPQPVNPPPQPVTPTTPVTVAIPPVDTQPIQNTIDQGFLDIQNKIAQMINLQDRPEVQKTVNQIFIDSLKSRKFILSVLASLTAFVNSTFHLGLTQDQLMIFILPILAFVIVEGAADIVQRNHPPQKMT